MSRNILFKVRIVLFAVASLVATTALATSFEVKPEQLRQLGRQRFADGNYAAAEQLFRFALKTSKPEASAEVAETLGDLSGALISQERYLEAEQLLTQAIGLLNSRPSSNQSHRPILLGNLGAIYKETGRKKLAEETFIEALNSSQKYRPEDSGYSAALFSNLGSIYAEGGKAKLADSTFRKALSIVERHFGESSIRLEPILVNLAFVYERQKKWAIAESLLHRSLTIAENSLRRDHPDVSIVLEHLAVVHFRQKKLGLAEMELRRALAIERSIARAGGIRISKVSLQLSHVLAAERKYDEAATLYSAALAWQDHAIGPKTPEVALTLTQYPTGLNKLKNYSLADKMEFRAKQIRAGLPITVSVDPK